MYTKYTCAPRKKNTSHFTIPKLFALKNFVNHSLYAFILSIRKHNLYLFL